MSGLRRIAPWLLLPLAIVAWFVEPGAPLSTSLLAAPIGAIVWTWRGGRSGVGLFCACTGFSLFLAIELARLFRPGLTPDFRAPLIAAVVAPIVWWLLRFLPAQPIAPEPRRGPWRTRFCILFWFGLADGVVGLGVAAVFVVPMVRDLGLTPVLVATQLRKLPAGHTGLIGVAARIVAKAADQLGATAWLESANRIDRPADLKSPAWSGAATRFDGVPPDGRLRGVATVQALRQAIDSASPGDVILLQPGLYRIAGPYISFNRAGTPTAPITLRAPQLGSVILESELAEALKVAAPHWHFENLILKGVCANDSDCDNGFHIVGAAGHTVIHNLRIEDFNAQIKINGENGQFPDAGLIEHTTLIDNHPRHTEASVTPIDLVAASDWVIQDNLIADFVKDGGTSVSYGAFAKGAGGGTLFNRNVVICEWHLRGPNSETIGLSFGGGGTGQGLMRDLGRSGNEHADGVMTDNLIAFCTDDGIYLNRAANSVIRHNTLIGTSGIDVRYPRSTATIEANIVDGAIGARAGGTLSENGNQAGSVIGMFLGDNPVRALFEDPTRLDLRWRQVPERVATEPGTDLCGADWAALSPAGAFVDFKACGSADKP